MKELEPETLSEEQSVPFEETSQIQFEGIKSDKKISIAEKWQEIMKTIKAKTGIDGIYVIIFLLLCVFLVYLGIFGSLITNMVGTLYPGFSTIKSMEKKKNKKKWLTYWVVFGSFMIIDMFSKIIMKLIPFYFVLKILFLIWMFLPGSNGCYLVYNFIIFKLFKSIENIVDFFFAETKDISKQLIKETKEKGKQLYESTKNKGIKKVEEIKKGLKVFKGLRLGKKGDMSEAIQAAQELEMEKSNENPLYGKQFYSSLILPSRDKSQKNEEKLKSVKPIKEEEIINNNKVEEDNNKNKEQEKKIEEDDDNIDQKLDLLISKIKDKKEEKKENDDNQNENDERLEFSDEIKNDEKNEEK